MDSRVLSPSVYKLNSTARVHACLVCMMMGCILLGSRNTTYALCIYTLPSKYRSIIYTESDWKLWNDVTHNKLSLKVA